MKSTWVWIAGVVAIIAMVTLASRVDAWYSLGLICVGVWTAMVTMPTRVMRWFLKLTDEA